MKPRNPLNRSLGRWTKVKQLMKEDPGKPSNPAREEHFARRREEIVDKK